MMRFLAAAAFAALVATVAYAQASEGTTTICKGVTIPDGYTIADEGPVARLREGRLPDQEKRAGHTTRG